MLEIFSNLYLFIEFVQPSQVRQLCNIHTQYGIVVAYLIKNQESKDQAWMIIFQEILQINRKHGNCYRKRSHHDNR